MRPGRNPCPDPAEGPETRLYRCPAPDPARANRTPPGSWLDLRELALDLVEDPGRLAAPHLLDVVLILEQDAERRIDGIGVEIDLVELDQGVGPVDGLGNAGQLEQVLVAQFLDEGDHLARQLLARSRHLDLEDFELRAASG